MRIGIDVRYLSHGLVGGVHTYLANFVPALLEQAPAHQVVLYADTKRPFELDDLPPQATLRLVPWRGPLSTVYHDLFLWRAMAHDRLDVVHFPANYGFGPPGARTVITVHDAINLLPLREIVRGHRKTPGTIAMMTYLHVLTRAALRRADLLLTVSRHAALEIGRQGGVDPDGIVAIPHAPAADLRRIEDPELLAEVRRRHGLRRRFVLADALKNPAVLVSAWRLLPDALRAEREIVFFSRRPDPLSIVQQAVARGEARLLVNPSRADLVALYSLAEAFVFPSWLEGFGLPVLEAMRCGAPVLASNRGAIPEVAGGAALLSEADDAEALARHLGLVLGSPLEAERLRRLGIERAAGFSWSRTASAILASYERAVGVEPAARLRPVAAGGPAVSERSGSAR